MPYTTMQRYHNKDKRDTDMRKYFLFIFILFLIIPSCSQEGVWESSQEEVSASDTNTSDPCPLDNPNDTDGDGVCDSDDICIGDDASGDTDSDSVCDDIDICTGDDATGDTDSDSICNDIDICTGDNATGDTDSDSVCDDLDICTGDDASGNTDSDSLCNNLDNCPALSNPLQTDTDGDNQGDACDTDDDNDGLLDPLESTNGTNPLVKDTDGDGAYDGLEVLLGTDPLDPLSYPLGAKCADIVTSMNAWGMTAWGVDLRAYTNSTLHWIGCPTDGCNPTNFYCNDDALSIRFGLDPLFPGDTLRAIVDPGDALFDAIPGGFSSCCDAASPNDICNAPDGNDNGQPVDSIKAMCQALGYNNGQLIRAEPGNSCPEVHAVSADGLDWTSDFSGSAGYGAEYECYQ